MEKFISYSQAEKVTDPTKFFTLDMIQSDISLKQRKIISYNKVDGELRPLFRDVIKDQEGNSYYEVIHEPQQQQFLSLLLKDFAPVCDVIQTEDRRYWSKVFNNNNNELKPPKQIEAEVAFLEIFTRSGDRIVDFKNRKNDLNVILRKKRNQNLYARSFFDLDADVPFFSLPNKAWAGDVSFIVKNSLNKMPGMDLEYLQGLFLNVAKKYDVDFSFEERGKPGRDLFMAIIKKSNIVEAINYQERQFLPPLKEEEVYDLFCLWVGTCLIELSKK